MVHFLFVLFICLYFCPHFFSICNSFKICYSYSYYFFLSVILSAVSASYLYLLFLCVEHVGVDAQWSQHAHHQLLLSQPRSQLIGRWCETTQPIGARLQFSLPLGCSLIGCLPARVWGKQRMMAGVRKHEKKCNVLNKLKNWQMCFPV